MKRLILSAFLVIIFRVPAVADEYPRDPDIDVVHYTFDLRLDDGTAEIAGEASVTVRFVGEGVSVVSLDLVGEDAPDEATGMRVTNVRCGGEAVPFGHRNDRLELQLATPSRKGEERTFTIAYRGVPADGLIITESRHGNRTFFGDNWPDRARYWLPTVDHPSDKATVEFIVTAPDPFEVVSNGRLVEDADLPGPLRRTHWRSDAPLPTKVMVIGVADFAMQEAGRHEDIPVQSWVYPEDRERGFYDFATAPDMLAFFTDWIGPFPYEKLANVQSTTRYGGMENAGAIFYPEDAITGRRLVESTVAHEVAHQWFGDSVTEADWHHIWLSEGFATYFAELYAEAAYGRERMLSSMKTARERVFAYERHAPFSPLVDTTIANLNELLSPNSYQKGAWVLHMLRFVVGDEAFQAGIRRYYEQFRHGNALTVDFQRAMQAASGRDLDWFFEQWVHRPGHMRLSGTWTYDAAAGQVTVVLEQPDGNVYSMPVELAIVDGAKNEPRIEVVQVKAERETFSFPVDAEPGAVVLDPNTWLLMEGRLKRD